MQFYGNLAKLKKENSKDKGILNKNADGSLDSKVYDRLASVTNDQQRGFSEVANKEAFQQMIKDETKCFEKVTNQLFNTQFEKEFNV